jgi:hypothetical protein
MHCRHWHLRHTAAWRPRCTHACRRFELPRPAASPRMRRRRRRRRNSSSLAACLRLCGWPAQRRRASARCLTPLRRLPQRGVASRASCEQLRCLASSRRRADTARLPPAMQACLVPPAAPSCCLAARQGCARCRAATTLSSRWSSLSPGRLACSASAPHPRTRCPAAPVPAAYCAWTRSEPAVETRSSSTSRHRCQLPVTASPATPAAQAARCLVRRWR